MPARDASGSPLSGLPNLGPRSTQWLHAAGIDTLERLRQLGAAAAFVQVRRSGAPASLNLLWALEGALSGLPWQQVAKLHRTSLLLAVETLEKAPVGALPSGRAAARRQ